MSSYITWLRCLITVKILISLTILQTDSSRVRRVVGGLEIDCGSQIRVASLRDSSSRHLCGAVLVTEEFALTAAHCIQVSCQYVLHLSNLCDTPQQATVLEVVKHPDYDKYTRAHDIASLRIQLDTHIGWSEDILPNTSFGLSGSQRLIRCLLTKEEKEIMCYALKVARVLASAPLIRSMIKGADALLPGSTASNVDVDQHRNSECLAYGYGSTGSSTEVLPGHLKAARLKIISLDECTNILGFYLAPRFDYGMMCALGNGEDTCQGDSGGPLMCAGKLQGISSYGLSCAVPTVPGMYTSIGLHLPWIRHSMEFITKKSAS